MIISVIPALYENGSTFKLKLRDWPIENWIYLVHLLKKQNFNIGLILTKSHIKKFSAVSKDIPIFTPPNLANLVDLIKKSSLVITQDSGVMHLASFVGVKVIALFGPTDPKIFANDLVVSITANNMSCLPCHNGINFTIDCKKNICMHSISPHSVYIRILENI